MEEESNIRKQKKKTLTTSIEVPTKMEKSSFDENPKQTTITTDEDSPDKPNKVKPKISKDIGAMSRKSRKVKTKRKEPGLSMYAKLKESSKRSQYQSRKSLRRKQRADAVIRNFYSRAKSRLHNKGRAQSNARNQEGIVCPDEISKQIDVPEEYDTEMMKEKTVVDPEVSAIGDLFPMNNENNGHLFMNGVPFWCLKDEKPPMINCIGLTTTLKDLIDKKFTLLKELPEPKDLDPFHEMTTMTNRDEEYFNKTNRVVSNTVRSIVGANDHKKTSEMHTPKNASARNNVIDIQVPTNMYVYNRRSRFETMATVSFTPGALAKRKKGILANFFF